VAPGVASEETEATSIGTETCLECHDGAGLNPSNVHFRIEEFEVHDRTVGCESCHGAGSLHAEGEVGMIQGFAAEDDEASAACIGCHRGKGLHQWQASTHAIEGIGCTDCHSIHADSEADTSCSSCHGEQVARFRLPSHHPLPEGKMSCDSCHDVHSANDGMLRTSLRENDLCYTCHQAKEGPFIFEHAPVQEDCNLCHEPHGTVANNLLTANEPVLCLQCHEFHFHAGYQSSDDSHVDIGGIERENPFGAEGFNMAYTSSCTQCHSSVHGSDHPSQTVTGRGSLVR
jgi:DmsE family decaheme c-type cytochrome